MLVERKHLVKHEPVGNLGEVKDSIGHLETDPDLSALSLTSRCPGIAPLALGPRLRSQALVGLRQGPGEAGRGTVSVRETAHCALSSVRGPWSLARVSRLTALYCF